jgi:outer membrane murein-binding lipoprotein Lpp
MRHIRQISNIEKHYKQLLLFIFNLNLIQFIFKYLFIINIIYKVIYNKLNMFYLSILESVLHIINIGYNIYRFDKIEEDVNTLKEDVNTLKEDVNTLKEDVNTLKEDVNTLKEDVKEIKDILKILVNQQTNT